MSNYSKTTDFAAKDALATGNANKIVKGTEIDDEFDAIQVAVNTKADINNTTFTGTTTIPSINCNGGAIDATVIGGDTAAAVTATTIRTPLIEYTDGDDAIVIADGGGVTVANLTATTADVNGGTIDNTVIGGNTKAAGTFTNVVSDYLQVDGGTLAVDNVNNRVGINSNSPTTDLDVVGNAKVSGTLTATALVGDGSGITGIAVQSKEIGAIGTYAFCEYVGADGSLDAGSTTAGSNLRYAGVAENPNVSGDSAIVVQSSGTPTGTWRIMGYLNKRLDYKVTSMFLRIS
jgi:hypothetical protein